mmetsp:Transcript_2338/g.5443  ORF Transcript_2338/g.5443 Transcript_2338/m.5443 type:complete len:332 (-) Transcript_2338:577-1572(-)
MGTESELTERDSDDKIARLLQSFKVLGAQKGWGPNPGGEKQPPKLALLGQVANDCKPMLPPMHDGAKSAPNGPGSPVKLDGSNGWGGVKSESQDSDAENAHTDISKLEDSVYTMLAGSKAAAELERKNSELSLKRKNSDDMESSSDENGDGPPKKKQHQSRGAHVKERPEMHATARSGQRHWGSLVQILRQEWEDKRVGEAFPHFQDQIRMCTRSHIKSQHECLLRMLQIAALDGIIIPLRFIENEKESFLGWTGFQINPHKSTDFQTKIASMFETSTKQNTINNAFRRAGLVPDQCWGRAWRGLATFQYKPDKRAVYNRSTQDINAIAAG